MVKLFLCFGLLMYFIPTVAQVVVHSPDKRIEVKVHVERIVRYSVTVDNQQVIEPSTIDLITEQQGSLLTENRIRKTVRRSVNETIIPVVPEKRLEIPDRYNEATLTFNRNISVTFRVFNDGLAYRLSTTYPDSLVIVNEVADMIPDSASTCYYTAVQKRENVDIFHTSFEENYTIKRIDSVASTDIIFTPTLISTPAYKLVYTESDLEDYPGMFLTRHSDHGLKAIFAGYPLEEKVAEGEFPQAIVVRRAPYIARTAGTRSFPWRVIAIASHDKELPGNDIVYRLASPSRVSDPSFIRPGKGTDEWITNINLFNVPFRAGINTASYKYYIDFAKKYGLERIMLDAGWSDYKDLFKIHPDLDMDELAAYARSQGIRLSMWTLAMTLSKQLDSALEMFSKWGVDFIMTDFIDRDDQIAVEFHHRIAKACGDKKIMLMFHGSFKPAGFNRTYPHAVTREGVLGSEWNAWSERATPGHNVLIPFIRMVSGPLDYEPGLMDNATRETFRPIWNKVMSMGTRCHQLAMFVVYESPIQIFSGNPSKANLEPDYMHLLGKIPTTWDETQIVDARLGEYIVTARRKGNDWFIAGMTNWTGRELQIPLDFLGEGQYEATVCRDGINADRYASDYIIEQASLTGARPLEIKLAPGGGFLVHLKLK